MSDPLVVRVGGRRYTGWTEVEITRPFDALSGGFSLKAVPRRVAPWPIPVGAEITVEIAGEPVITGYVDQLRASQSRSGSAVEVAGRDRTADLNDASAVHAPGQWKGLLVDELARVLAKPFGVEVELEGTPELAAWSPFETFALEQGETAGAAIERACRLRGVLARTDGRGVLVIGETAARPRAAVALVEGENVKSIDVAYTYTERFATYIVRGQAQGGDTGWGAQVAAIEGRALDAEVPRYRPLLVIAEGPLSDEAAKLRAQWEAIVRAARSATIEVELASWLQFEGGPPWRAGELVQVRYPSLAIDSEVLVAEVGFSRSRDSGSSCKLSLVRRDAYVAKPEVPKGRDWDPLYGLKQGGDEEPVE